MSTLSAITSLLSSGKLFFVFWCSLLFLEEVAIVEEEVVMVESVGAEHETEVAVVEAEEAIVEMMVQH